jgi:hypothetical protein
MGAIGFVLFAGCVIYYVIDESRTGIRYRAHRKVLFPTIGIGWLLVAGSIVTNSAAEGTLGDFVSAPCSCPRDHLDRETPQQESAVAVLRQARACVLQQRRRRTNDEGPAASSTTKISVMG